MVNTLNNRIIKIKVIKDLYEELIIYTFILFIIKTKNPQKSLSEGL